MADSTDRSRRSFLATLFTGAAGGWVAVTGLATAASSALTGCPVTAKYGGPPQGGSGGGSTTPPPPPPRRDPPPPPPPRKKARKTPEPPPPDPGPTTKYGGRKYGGPIRMTKYGGRR